MNCSTRLFRYSLVALAASTGLVACDDNNDVAAPPAVTPPAPTPPTPDTFVLTSANKLVGFAAASSGTVSSSVTLAIPTTETLLGGDFRPADRALYVVTRVNADNSLKVYTADTTTGALGTAVVLRNTGMGAGGGTAGAPVTLAATSKVGVDFNPLANALRIVDSTGVNLRTTLAATGNNTFIDAPISAGLAETAYTNAFADTCQTDQYYVSATQLLLTGAFNGVVGNLATPRLVGALGVTADNTNIGFDVRTAASGNTLTAALPVGGSYSLYEISTTTGAATRRGAIGGLAAGENVLALTTSLAAAGSVPNAAGNLLAITAGTTQNLVTFNRPPQGSPNRLCSSNAITGLASGDVIVGADTRPNGGQLFALAKNGTVGTLYTVTAAGAATRVAPLTQDASDTTAPYTGLDGTAFSVDFNPIPDRLRVHSNTGQNLRLTVAPVFGTTPIAAGAVTTDTALTTGGNPRTGITASAYTNSIFGGNAASLTTTLYAIDSSTDVLALIGGNPGNGTAGDAGNPNSGIVVDVGALGVDITEVNAFDIDARTGTALLAATPLAQTTGPISTLYTVNLSTGAATRVQDFAAPIVALGSNGSLTATVFGVTPTNKLVSFAPSAPGTVTAVGTISVPAGETVQGIDFRPSIGPKNGTLVALTTAAGGAAKLYTVDPATGAATALSTLAANAADTTAPFTAATGSNFGIDFNPLPDALRTVSDSAQNLRTNPDSGATFTDGNLSVTGVFGAGYANNFTTTASAPLFYLRDVAGGNSTLHTTTAPNDGVLTLVGTDLGADYSAVGDLDIAGGQNGFSLAALQPQAGGASGLFRINTTTGVASSVGSIATAGSEPLVGIAIQLR